MTTLIPHEYPALLGVLKERIRAAQYREYSALPNLQPLVGEVTLSRNDGGRAVVRLSKQWQNMAIHNFRSLS